MRLIIENNSTPTPYTLHPIPQILMTTTTQQPTINPAFAGYAAKYIREASDDLQRVFDNLLEIGAGDVPDANGYDRLRATRILYDRGFGKVNKNTPQSPPPAPKSNQPPEPEEPPKSEESPNQDDQGSDDPQPEQSRTAALDLKDAPPGATTHLVSQIEQKLDDILGPTQKPAEPDLEEAVREPPLAALAAGFVPDIVRDSQYYVLEITDYGAKLADILMSIHEPDPDDDTIRQCHRVTAGQMMIDRVLGPAVSLQYDLDHAYDPAEDPYWALRHPSEIDSRLTPEELKEVDRMTRNFAEGIKQEDDGECDDCTDDYLCEYHDPDGEYYEDANVTDEEIEILARGMRNIFANEDRLYFDPAAGRLKLRPRNYIDDS